MKFVCGYCKSEYDTPIGRARCELECDLKRFAEEEKRLKEKLAKEKEERKQEIYDVRKRVMVLEDKYFKDYGERLHVFREPIVEYTKFNKGSNVDNDAINNALNSFLNDCFG